MPFPLDVRSTSFPKRKKIAGPDPTNRLVNVRSTMPPVTSIPAADLVSRLQLSDSDIG
jgi:hypothetical protein